MFPAKTRGLHVFAKEVKDALLSFLGRSLTNSLNTIYWFSDFTQCGTFLSARAHCSTRQLLGEQRLQCALMHEVLQCPSVLAMCLHCWTPPQTHGALCRMAAVKQFQ